MDGCLGFWTDPNFSFEAGSVNVDGIYYGSVQEYLKATRSDGSAGIGSLRLTTPLATVAAERVAIRCKKEDGTQMKRNGRIDTEELAQGLPQKEDL